MSRVSYTSCGIMFNNCVSVEDSSGTAYNASFSEPDEIDEEESIWKSDGRAENISLERYYEGLRDSFVMAFH